MPVMDYPFLLTPSMERAAESLVLLSRSTEGLFPAAPPAPLASFHQTSSSIKLTRPPVRKIESRPRHILHDFLKACKTAPTPHGFIPISVNHHFPELATGGLDMSSEHITRAMSDSHASYFCIIGDISSTQACLIQKYLSGQGFRPLSSHLVPNGTLGASATTVFNMFQHHLTSTGLGERMLSVYIKIRPRRESPPPCSMGS